MADEYKADGGVWAGALFCAAARTRNI